MNALRFITLWLLLVLLASAGFAQTGVPASREDFIKGIADHTYECSFTSYAKVRFFENRIEILNEDGKLSRTVKDTKIVEPGVIVVSLIKGGTIWFAFSDQLDTFCVANMKEVHPFELDKAGSSLLKKWPKPLDQSPILLELTAHPEWSKIRIEGEKATPILKNGVDGEAFPVVRFSDHSLGAFYKKPGQKSGVSQILLSREGTRGWLMEGDHLGTGAKTFRNRDATARRSSILDASGFARRSNQFGWYLLKMGKLDEALAQEKYSEYYLNDNYGPESKYTIDGLKVMGELRGSAMRYELAPYWLKKAGDLAKVTYQDEPEKIMEFDVALANAYVEAGQYEEAINTLKGMASQPDLKARFKRTEYDYVYVISEASFGTGNYAKAETWQKACADRAHENEQGNWVIDGMLGMISCHLATGNRPAALNTLAETIAYQEERQKKAKPGTKFETHELALACVALEQWDSALQFSNEGDYKTSFFEFEEVVRLLSLWNSGDKAGATSFAEKIASRFQGDLSNTLRSRDSTELFVAIIEVLSDPGSPEKVAEFRKTLSEQRDFLKKRPLRNFLLISVIAKADRLLEG